MSKNHASKSADHHRARKGASVRVVLRDGTEFIDTFVERRSKHYIFATEGRVATKSVARFLIQRGSVAKN